jgi:hypothetical protein
LPTMIQDKTDFLAPRASTLSGVCSDSGSKFIIIIFTGRTRCLHICRSVLLERHLEALSNSL